MYFLINLGLLAISIGTNNPNWAIAAGIFAVAEVIETKAKHYIQDRRDEYTNDKLHNQ